MSTAAIIGGALLWVTGKPAENTLALALRIDRDGAALVFSGRS